MSQIKLYTYAVSQASEKVRWALDSARIPYREYRLTPFVHAGELFRSMPVLEADGQSIADSTRILEWLEMHRAPFPLMPRDPLVRAAVMEAEARFDQAGISLLRWVYAGLLANRALALRLWSPDANLPQRVALRVGFPVIRRLFERGVGFDGRQMGRTRRIIDRTIGELDRMVESGRPYLVGASISAADITAAALLAPLACPHEHPVYGCPDYREPMESTLRPWQGRPGIEWVRTMYARHRTPTPWNAESRRRRSRCRSGFQAVEPTRVETRRPGSTNE